MKRNLILLGILWLLLAGLTATGVTGAAGNKDEAVAMVKKAIEYTKANGQEKAFAEINNPKGQFVDRDLYVVVYDMNAKCLSHGANPKMIGKELMDFRDVDGKEYMKERLELMKKGSTGWQNYKFMNPVTKQIEPKAMYLERFGDLIFGCGVYN